MTTPDEYGGYRVLRMLGEGGTGVVYLAEQAAPASRQVALKVIKPGMNARDVLGRFEGERHALAAIDHPNIASVLDAGMSRSGHPYFVMEYVPGTPITSYCDECRLSVRQRLELFLPVCSAVQYAHQRGIIHRGIKPSTLLVAIDDGTPHPRIIDFGIARATEPRPTNAIVRTGGDRLRSALAYMSPEQAGVTGLDIDARTDVYALGVILYEMLVGVPPFCEEELQGLSALYAVLERDPPTLGRRFDWLGDRRAAIAADRRTDVVGLTRQLRGDLEWVARKAMAKDRSRRYGTADELSLELQRHLSDHPVLARPSSVVYRTGKLVRRHGTAVLIAAGVVVAASIVAAYVLC